ncbi:hypothetical protein JZO73_08040 [Enterococcus plantarum]|uniref:hypothetical protein n=1 Tax=Enterococcus plantarum TaxID=1077675 RepID=UPI001A906652|nr:hypothetical protein [Enterococcus plantarum]MBO0467486.1 hypothetical protein [Enterococcus plantarum]
MDGVAKIIPHNPIYLVKSKGGGYDSINEEEWIRRNKIKKGMQQSIKKMGRPSKIDNETLKKSYGKWLSGILTQKQIAEILGVSERTVNRKFSSYKNNL